jgi:hypothetical protein
VDSSEIPVVPWKSFAWICIRLYARDDYFFKVLFSIISNLDELMIQIGYCPNCSILFYS